MFNLLNNTFTYLSKNLLVALIVFFVSFFLTMEIYEKVFLNWIKNKNKFINNKDREIYSGFFLIGLLHLTLAIIVNYYFVFIFIWALLSAGITFGGLLGLIPFSFLENGKNKK